MTWLWFGIVTGAIIAVTWTLREHRKMLATLAQKIIMLKDEAKFYQHSVNMLEITVKSISHDLHEGEK